MSDTRSTNDMAQSGSGERSPADGSITAVVCCYTEDRWDQIVAAVNSLLHQTLPPSQLIVVVDHNDVLLERCAATFATATVVPNKYTKGLSGGKNTALELVASEFVAFLDDDAVAEPIWLEQLVRHMERPEVVCAGSRVDPLWERPARWFPDEMAWTVGCSYRGLPETPAAIRNTFGGASLYRTSAVRQLDGFSSELGRVAGSLGGGEETEFSIRLASVTGGQLIFDPTVAIDHHVPATRTQVGYVLRRCRDEGRSKALLSKRAEVKNSLGDEQSYLTHTVPTGIARYLRQALTGDVSGLARALVLVAGVAAAGIGFVPASLRLRFP